ncbi:hypothetical protein RWV98_02800 [Agathobaculum sp. NTUH-O15-33]|uniref:hypothetical protein n=1 Tax=Agathobaculum sp. NTUH-O15-33 TaxID=3079302 RepID=UPI002958DA15|nr:hypothetical protein [Agathobaculum sp. NTUH-O15-33]WNX85221.1 hypothetical protein RWV98_02800 [Agathobaculum sp. NTUH-O15-33]
MKHTTCHERRTIITKMQRDLVAKAMLAAKDGDKYRQAGARRISKAHLTPDEFFATCRPGYQIRVRPDGTPEYYIPMGESEVVLDETKIAAHSGSNTVSGEEEYL